MSDNIPDFRVSTPAVDPRAFADVLQRKQNAEDVNMRAEEQRKNDRLKRILDAVQGGQAIANNMMNLAQKRNQMKGEKELAGLMTPVAPPAPTASSTALPEAGNFSVQPSPEQNVSYQDILTKRKQNLMAALMRANPEATTTQMAEQMFASNKTAASQARLFINTEGQSMMIAPDENGRFNAPEGFKDPTIARAEVFAEPRKEANAIKVAQFDEKQWNQVGKAMNSLDKSSRSAVGMAAVGNQRAARALKLLDDPNMDNVLKKYVESDLAGIMQGGAPHETMLKQAGYDNLATKWASVKQLVLSEPQALKIPEIREQLRETIQGIVEVDNEVLDTNAGLAKESFLKAIQSDPERFNRMMKISERVKALAREPESKTSAVKPPLDSFFK